MQLRLSRVPMARCIATCPQCKLPGDEYLIAESGMGGDFQTFRHVGSGALYRHDLTLAQYNPKAGAEAMRVIEVHAGGADQLREVPGQQACKVCGKRYAVENASMIAGSEVEVFVVVGG